MPYTFLFVERANELECSVQELEEELELQQEEATRAISQWESRCSELDEKVVELVNEQKEGARAMSQYEARCSDLDKKVVKLVDELCERSSDDAYKKPNAELIQLMKEVQSLQERIKELETEVTDQALLQNRTYELERALENEQEIVRATEASLATKSELMEKLEMELSLLREEVESDASEILVALSKERAARDVAEQNLAALKESVSETERALADLQSQEEQIFKGSRQGMEDLYKTQRLLEEKESLLKDVIQERDDLKAVVGELQEDLRDASDALQACVTDEISEKATEVASHALKCQMEQMSSQLEKDRELCFRENRARLAAEKEAESLRIDLANVLGITEGIDDPQAQIQRMTMRAAEEIQQRERAEIEELRKALERALKDLASAQAAERNALANAASSRLQLSVCEQEVISAKSDLAFLTQTLEETRDADASKAASLEYRISSLEDDREVLRRFHADELENLRNELTHVSMEKDRIFHSLKETEKKNAAIVFSTSKKGESPEKSSPDDELARLRIEKAQLLSAAAEEGSRAERRIREAVAAQYSSVEADFILERELRATAETAVEDLRFQIEVLKSRADQDSKSDDPETGTEKADRSSTSVLDQVSAELDRLKEENRTLTTGNAALQKQLEKAKAELSADIVELTEKWRKAQARAHMLESNVSFDAEVNKEVVKLRATHDVDEDKSENWIVLTDNPVDSYQGPALSAMDAYDLVHEQKIAIQEERAMYLELLADHDDLLALLAQQDLEKASLHAALARLAGQEAVDDAMAVAEENAVHQFGKYVKLS
jgi:DNA repair exonuclease SbcCD ATPase subunit